MYRSRCSNRGAEVPSEAVAPTRGAQGKGVTPGAVEVAKEPAESSASVGGSTSLFWWSCLARLIN